MLPFSHIYANVCAIFNPENEFLHIPRYRLRNCLIGDDHAAVNNSFADVARRADTSISSVSRALSGKPGVSENKRRQILQIAGMLGVVRDEAASALRTGRGQGLTLLVRVAQTEVVNRRNLELVNLGKLAFGSVRLVVWNSGEDVDPLVHQAVRQRTGALIVSGFEPPLRADTRELLRERKVPLTTVDAVSPHFDSVGIRRAVGTFQAARMLLLTGRRHIVYLSPTDWLNPDQRLVGVQAAYVSMGLGKQLPRLMPFTQAGYATGYDCARRLLSEGPLDALFAYNDHMAIGAMRAFAEAGVRVPEDVALVGFDDLPVSAFLPVPLTTVAQPMQDPVEATIRLTLERLESPHLPPRQESFPTRLIVRDSAGIPAHSLRAEIFQNPPEETLGTGI